jgi:hypothetical protein
MEDLAEQDDLRRTVSSQSLAIIVASIALIAALLGIGAVWLVGTSSSVACELNEAREGSHFEAWEGRSLDEVRELAARQHLDLQVEAVERSTVEPGTVVAISQCGGSDALQVLVAREPT